jgi:7,8-dihydropterin-6-yl-methyl-4-(beta-D-ribofuranosyl)aminobenzene 5'-phosphate synthase
MGLLVSGARRGQDDTLRYRYLLLANMGELGIDPQEIKMVMLSHIHGDHVEELASLLRQNHELTVVIPTSFPADFKEAVRRSSALGQEVEGFIELCRDV